MLLVVKMRNWKAYLILIFITLLGAYLRLHALSPFKIYPDSYQNLLVAQNIQTYRSVVSYLGEKGMLYPPFFIWSRPMYPLLITLVQYVTNDITNAAILLSLSMGVLSIPLSYIFITTVLNNGAMKQLNNTIVGISGAMHIALSFNHTNWGGYIMTETTGVFVLLLFIWHLFSILNTKPRRGSFKDILCGILFGAAIFTRYEYSILLIPLFILLIWKSPKPLLRIINLVSGLLITTIVCLFALFPLPSTLLLIPQQTHILLTRAGIIILVFGITIGAFFTISKKQRVHILQLFHTFIVTTVSLFPILIAALIFLPSIPFISSQFAGLMDFIKDDIFLSISAYIGILLLIQDKQQKHLAYFSLSSIILLYVFYIRMNPAMERYMTHLIPFLLIPASYAVFWVYQTEKLITDQPISENRKLRTDNWSTNKNIFIVIFLFILLSCYQLILTYHGFRQWGDKSWYSMSYEEKSARTIRDYLRFNQRLSASILIASFPEPYYYFTNVSTQSIADTYPYVYIDESLNSQQVLIIQDMGMHDIFPHFSDFLTKNMSNFAIHSFKTNIFYHYGFRSEKEEYPVILYQTKLEILKKKITEQHRRT
jgi:hypothetical protein